MYIFLAWNSTSVVRRLQYQTPDRVPAEEMAAGIPPMV